MGIQRVTDLADPRRCKGRSLDGQCKNVAEEGADYCRVHGGESQAPARRLKQYLLTTAQDCARLARISENEGLKTLREEVAVALGLLERRLSLARTDAEFVAAFPQIEKFLGRIADLKKDSFSLEQKSGSMLSRDQAFGLFQEIVGIVVEEMEGVPGYERIMDRIIARIGPVIQHAGNSKPETA
ncbi:MAG: hypothetical protein JW741_18900 [Sedimentisphaerales bacterium]|nr:hypothetical protein [Sedimentisphaerales bacterium]